MKERFICNDCYYIGESVWFYDGLNNGALEVYSCPECYSFNVDLYEDE